MTSCIGEMTTLEGLPDRDKADGLMKEVAKWVEPLMRAHSWFVPLFAERNFSGNVLGMNYNGGQKIEIRLRRMGGKDTFYHLESLMDTMLHELAHNVHQNHSSDFYDLWEKLRKELAANLSKGIFGTGQGFDAKGYKADTSKHNPVSTREAKGKAARAAEERLKRSSLFGSGPQTLGGRQMGNLDAAESARRAAMRRSSNWCQIGEIGEDVKSNAIAKPLEKRARVVIDLVDSGEEEKKLKSSSFSIEPPLQSGEEKKTVRVPNSSIEPQAAISSHSEQETQWNCEVCTLANAPELILCSICDTARPGYWKCSTCLFANKSLFAPCAACARPRALH